jgi:TPR repeat protein
VGQSGASALGWYRKAAEAGHADAQFNLGALYLKGLGVAKSEAEAEVSVQ